MSVCSQFRCMVVEWWGRGVLSVGFGLAVKLGNLLTATIIQHSNQSGKLYKYYAKLSNVIHVIN